MCVCARGFLMNDKNRFGCVRACILVRFTSLRLWMWLNSASMRQRGQWQRHTLIVNIQFSNYTHTICQSVCLTDSMTDWPVTIHSRWLTEKKFKGKSKSVKSNRYIGKIVYSLPFEINIQFRWSLNVRKRQIHQIYMYVLYSNLDFVDVRERAVFWAAWTDWSGYWRV